MLLTVAPARAFWTFSSVNTSSQIRCSGEANNPNYAESCELYSSWGTHVLAFDDGGVCAAVIDCPEFLRGCWAGETFEGNPGLCTAFSYYGPFPLHPAGYKATCKSDDYGVDSQTCDQ
jgi:hypothetical protein